MPLKTITGFIGKRELIALGILAGAFAVFMTFQFHVWAYIAVALLFVGYASRTAAAFFMTQQNYSGRRIAAYAMPVGLAVTQALVCLGLVWLVVRSVRRLLGA
jgi:hypothetical protein